MVASRLGPHGDRLAVQGSRRQATSVLCAGCLPIRVMPELLRSRWGRFQQMPIYEYQCNECEHHFELLRPPREASMAQPCPDCDADSRRVMSTQWSAFTFRDGRPRQLPDDGGYYHLGKKVSQPITGAVRGIEHPEVNKKPPPKPLTIEEMEHYEYAKEHHVETMLHTGVEPRSNA